jgi:hypothetical protein
MEELGNDVADRVDPQGARDQHSLGAEIAVREDPRYCLGRLLFYAKRRNEECREYTVQYCRVYCTRYNVEEGL